MASFSSSTSWTIKNDGCLDVDCLILGLLSDPSLLQLQEALGMENVYHKFGCRNYLQVTSLTKNET